MNKPLKYTLVAAGGLVVLFAVVLAIVALTVDPNKFKPQVVQLVQEKKQRTLTLEGDIKLKLFPKLGVDLGKTRLSEHKGSGEFAAVDSVRLYVAWLPLLRKELVVDTVTVEGARANLVLNEDGSTNFDDLLSKEESEQVKFDIDGVRVEKSALRLDDRKNKRKLALSDIELKTGRIRDNTHTDVALSCKLTANAPKLAANISLNSGLLFALKEKHYALDDLDLKASGDAFGISGLDLGLSGNLDLKAQPQEIHVQDLKLKLKGKREADKVDLALEVPKLLLTESKAEGAKLTLSAKLDQPAGLLNATLTLPDLAGNAKGFQVSQLKLGLEGKRGENAIKGELTSPFSGNLETLAFQLPKLAAKLQVANPKLPKGSMQLQLTGAAEADLGKQRAKADIQTRLDESNIQARLALEHFDPMRIGFDVSIDQLDADRYLQAKSPAPAKGGKAGPESPIDFSGLSSLNASGSIKIGRLKAAKVKASNVRLDVKAGGGRIEVNPLSANLYQGSMQGALSATTTPNPRISARQNLSGISIGPLLRDLADKDLLEGRGSVALNVSTQGPTVSTMKKALDGTAAVNLTNGAIKGVNVAAMLRRAQSALGGGIQTQAASTAEQTDFTELTASFNIRDGVAHNDDLSAKSPLLRLGGNGTIDIGASAMDYLAKATVVGTLEGQSGRELSQLKGVTVPIRVAGPFDALKYSLDPKALVTEAAKAQMEQKTEELKQKAGEKFFKGLFPR